MYIDVNEFINCKTDSEMIQSALDKASQTGESIVIPKINKRTGKDIWDITKTVYLYDGSTVILQNCHLRLADDTVCNMFANKNARSDDVFEKKQRDITIKGIGKAILDGGNHNGFYENNGIARDVSKYPDHHISENCMVFFRNVEHLVIDNITVMNQRYWAMPLYAVSYSHISNIHFESASNVPNQDGVDVLKGSHDIIIENITGCTGDNVIALLATDDPIYCKSGENMHDGDIYNITIRNVMVYGVGGCALIRLLNHDGFKIYNIRIDNVIETSPWSEHDSSVAQNPDLIIKNDKDGNIYHERHLIPGEKGYRCEAAILIGESYWYNTSKAQPGDTFGISVSNVMTHARYAVFLNNTIMDSSFDNIRLFGNGFMAVYFGEGNMENVRFSNVTYDKDCKPLKDDEHICIEWNNTKSDGLSCVYFNGTEVENIRFENMRCGRFMENVFGGNGKGNIVCKDIESGDLPINQTEGIEIIK